MREGGPPPAASALMPTTALADIYEAALRPAHWAVVLERLVEIFHGSGAILRTFEATPETAGMWFAHRIEQWALKEYVRHFHKMDVWESSGRARGYMQSVGVYVADMLLPREEFLATEFYRDFLRRQDIRDLLAVVVHDGSPPPMPLTVLSIYRGHQQPLFGEADLILARAFLPHLARAVEMNFQMAEMRHCAAVHSVAFEQFSPAMLFFNRSGVVINSNRQANALITAADGILVRDGHLAATNIEDDVKLQLLLEGNGGAEHGEADVVRISRPSGRLPYAVVRIAVPQDKRDPPDARQAHFAILLHDPSVVAELDLDTLGRLYGLTPAESRLVQALVDHGSAKSIFHHTNLNEHTVRSQLKAVLKKTGTRAQAELIRLALTVALRARG